MSLRGGGPVRGRDEETDEPEAGRMPAPVRHRVHEPAEDASTAATRRVESRSVGYAQELRARREYRGDPRWEAERRRRHPVLRLFGLGLVVLAAVILVGAAASLTVLRPALRTAVVQWAGDNSGALQFGVIKDLVREDIGAAMTTPASTDSTQVPFVVGAGDTARSIAERLAERHLLLDPRAFVYIAVENGVDAKLEAGDYVLRENMTPEQLVGALLLAKDPTIVVTFREGLRIEQMTAKLQTVPLKLDPATFYRLATHPTPELLASAPWLKIPEGRSLEGFLYPDTYRVLADTTAEELIRMLLERFHTAVGESRLDVAAERGLSFYQVLSLASIVEQEAIVDTERARIAGVYQNRIDSKMLLQADPTVIYAHDSMSLAKIPVEEWRTFVFWKPLDTPLAELKVSTALKGFQTYVRTGLIPGPICTPSLASIDAALEPDTAGGYLYFVAKGDGTNTHAFAQTYAQHLANLKRYGYQ